MLYSSVEALHTPSSIDTPVHAIKARIILKSFRKSVQDVPTKEAVSRFNFPGSEIRLILGKDIAWLIT